MQMKSLLERLKQEENRHQETKESIISERKELWMKLEAYVYYIILLILPPWLSRAKFQHSEI